MSKGVGSYFYNASFQPTDPLKRACNANMDSRDIVCIMPTGTLFFRLFLSSKL